MPRSASRAGCGNVELRLSSGWKPHPTGPYDQDDSLRRGLSQGRYPQGFPENILQQIHKRKHLHCTRPIIGAMAA